VYLKRKIAIKILGSCDTDKAIINVRSNVFKTFVYKTGSQFLIDRNYPLHIYLELSRVCNYKCLMCSRVETGSGGYFPLGLAKKIITESAKKGPTSYSLHMFGEPLANPWWYEIVKMIRDANPDNCILLTTNGFFMNEKNSRKLIDLKVDRIFVSFNSPDPEIYKTYTGGGDISVVLNNLKAFLKISNNSNRTKLFARLFLEPGKTRFEEGELMDFKELGIPLEIRVFHNFAGGQNEWSAYKSKVHRWPCYHPWFTLGITYDGKVTVCCADYSIGLEVGNTYKQSIEEIWKSEDVQSIRQEHLSNKFDRWKSCITCDTWQFHPDIFFDYQKYS
jgi:radical SAM protein with 4Fe4S-binding SPASM domain